MTWSYTSPPANDKDRVRFYSGDTVQRPYSVSDEDINFLLTELDGNVLEAAAVVCDRIADYWAVSETASGAALSVGPFSTETRSGAELEAAWRARAARLRSGSASGVPVIGDGTGVFTGDADPEFSLGMMDNGYQSYPPRSRRFPVPPNGVW